jgi:hypothetical protein
MYIWGRWIGKRLETLTVLLTSPSTGLEPVVTQTEGPFCVRTGKLCEWLECANYECYTAHRLPWSVVGGAKKSGFCLSMGSFVGPKMGAPREPRIASGFTVVDSLYDGKFGFSEMRGTVSEAGTALPAVVPVGFTVEDGLWLEDDSAIEEVGYRRTNCGTEEAAGADVATVAKSKTQRQEETRIMWEGLWNPLNGNWGAIWWEELLNTRTRKEMLMQRTWIRCRHDSAGPVRTWVSIWWLIKDKHESAESNQPYAHVRHNSVGFLHWSLEATGLRSKLSCSASPQRQLLVEIYRYWHPKGVIVEPVRLMASLWLFLKRWTGSCTPKLMIWKRHCVQIWPVEGSHLKERGITSNIHHTIRQMIKGS